jgi:DNA-binding XRE family transcriptional regulator
LRVSFWVDFEELALAHNHLREVRENSLISVTEFARKAGISPLTVVSVEKGGSCRLETKRRILAALGLKPLERETIFPEN